MVRTLALGLAALALVSTAASAHGPSRQKVTETVEINLGLCRYGDTEEDATKMAVRKDGTGWIAVCDDHVDQAEQDGFEVRDSD